MIDLKKMIDDLYSDDLDKFQEKGVLEALHQIEIWDKLNDYEKVIMRKERLNYYKKHSLIPSLRIEYEEIVVSVTERILRFLENTENLLHDSTVDGEVTKYLLRIKNLLYCEKEFINRNPPLKYVNHVLLDFFLPLIEKVKESKEYEIYKLEPLFVEYQRMVKLYVQKPYDNQ